MISAVALTDVVLKDPVVSLERPATVALKDQVISDEQITQVVDCSRINPILSHSTTEVYNSFSRDYLVLKFNNTSNKKIILHDSHINISDFNLHAKKSLELDNDSKKRSMDEAISIHIITDKLNTRLNILYESQISSFYGKPDFIIRLGKKLYIMVSTTRAVCRKSSSSKGEYDFTQKEADRLVKKKINGLLICKNNLECLVNDVITDDCLIRPILHILSPTKKNALMCIIAYNKILSAVSKDELKDFKYIKLIISCISYHENIL